MKMITLAFVCGMFSGCGYQESSDINLIRGAVGTIPQVVELSPVGCTGTVVGPHTMVTAGHCYGTGQVAKFMYRGKAYSAKMTRNAQYQDGPALHDHSLGVTAETMPGPYAYIDRNPVRNGETIQLQGYGCTKPRTWWGGGASGADHKLRIGKSQVIQISALEYTTRGGAALCFGDSGGSSFRLGTLGVLSINSKGNISDTSYLARVDIPSFTALVQKVGQTVCGVTHTCK